MAHNPQPRDYLTQPGRAHFIEWIVDDGQRAVAQFLQALPTACDQLLPFRDKRAIKLALIEIPVQEHRYKSVINDKLRQRRITAQMTFGLCV